MKEFNKQYIYLNHKRKNKWLGFIDYKSLLFLIAYIFIIINILRLINLRLEYSLYIFLFLVIPMVASIFVNINNDVAIDVILLIIKFYLKRGFFVVKINSKNFKKIMYKKI